MNIKLRLIHAATSSSCGCGVKTPVTKYHNENCKYRIIMDAYEEIDKLNTALEDAKLFSEWVETLGRTDCEIYKHELKNNADLAIERINGALGI